MSLYKNAFYWLIALLVVLLIGFWQSYFSQIGEAHLTHHFHGISMLLWVLLLISQSWLIRNRRNAQHRSLGQVSFLLAPAVVISGVMVVFHSQATAEPPDSPFALSIFWFGFFSAGMLAVFYSFAIRHRRKMQLHARYMMATALVFIVPGLFRAVSQYIGPTGVWIPSFYQMTWVPFLIGMWLMFRDWQNKQTIQPYLLFNVLWAINLVLWVTLPNQAWWQAFAAWSAENMG